MNTEPDTDAVPSDNPTHAAVSGRAEAEAALRSSNAELTRQARVFDSVLSSIPDSTYTLDLEGRFVYASKALLDLWGLSLEQAVGKNFFDLQYPGDLAARLQRQVQQVVEARQPIRDETSYTSPTGVEGYYEYIFAPTFDADGNVAGIAGSTREITARKRTELNSALLDRIARNVANQSSPDAIMAAVGSQLAAALDVSACIFADVDETCGEITVHHGWVAPDVPNLNRRFRLVDYLTQAFVRAGRAGETVMVCDTATDPRTDATAYAKLEIGAFVTVPFLRDGRWIAYFAATDRAPRDWRPDEVALFRAITDRIFPRIERARAEAALRESEGRYRALFDSIDEGFYLAEALFEGDACTDVRCYDENPAARQITGKSFKGHLLSERGNYEPWWCEIFGRVARTGNAERHERYAAPDDIWYDFYAFKPAGAGPGAVAVVFRDVTERRRAEESSSRLAAIVASSDDAVICKDLNGTIETWNAGAERMFGYAADEVLGKPATILMPPDRLDEEPDILARVRRGERVDRYETVGQRKDGSRLDISLSVSPIRDKDGNVVAASKVARDITERKLVESGLRESERRQGLLLMLSDAMREQADERAIGEVCVRMLAQHMQLDRCCIIRISREQDKAWPGPEYRRADLATMFGDAGELALSGLSPGIAAIESETLVVSDAAGDPRISGSDSASRAVGRMPAFVAVPMHEAGGNFIWALLAVSTTPRAWARGEVHVVENVAERALACIDRARVEAALRDREAELQRANRAKDEFLAMLGHELRNPLAPITTTLELMKLRAPDAFARERGIIEGQVRYLTELVDDLLDVARIARGKIELTLAPIDLGEVLAAAVEMAQGTVDEHRQSLHVRVEEGLTVSGDRRRLVQVVVNLLSNATKYSPRGRDIHLSAVADAGSAVLRVRDAGQGIAAALLPHVFEAFSQGAQSIDRTCGGLGLGLAIVRNIVVLHGGTVSASSDGEYKGSEFTVRLPLLLASRQTGEAVVQEVEVPRRAVSESGDRRVKVLIVDDYALAADTLAMLLQEMGYRTRVARDGAEGLEAIKSFAPQVALVDIGLPVIDGYEVAQTIRAMPGCERLPLVAVTGYGQPGDHVRVMTAGFNEHLVKPLDAAKIGDLIEKLVAAD